MRLDRKRAPGPYRQGLAHGAGKACRGQGSTAKGERNGGDREAKTPPWFRKTAVKRRAALGIPCCFSVPAGRDLGVDPTATQRGADHPICRHPVPVPHHQLESQFLVLTSAGAKKDLVEMSVAFAFSNTGAFERFKDRQAAIHDSCYRFIQTHNRRTTRKRTGRSWFRKTCGLIC